MAKKTSTPSSHPATASNIGYLEKDIIEHMTQSMTEEFYAYCKEKSKAVHELETGHLEEPSRMPCQSTYPGKQADKIYAVHPLYPVPCNSFCIRKNIHRKKDFHQYQTRAFRGNSDLCAAGSGE